MRNGSYRIGEVARRLGMNPRTIRFYEAAGVLLPPSRTEHGYASAGHRSYRPEDIRRLEFVRQARLLDLSLDQIRELAEASEDGCCRVARPHLKALIRQKLPELRRRIAEFRRLERRLTALERALPDRPGEAQGSCGGTVDQCVPLVDQRLLQIGRPAAGHGERRAS